MKHKESLVADIKQADVFAVLISGAAFFEDAMCITQAEIARSFKKEFIIFLKLGISIPPEYLKDVEYKIFTWNTQDELNNAFLTHMNSSTKGCEIDFRTPYED